MTGYFARRSFTPRSDDCAFLRAQPFLQLRRERTICRAKPNPAAFGPNAHAGAGMSIQYVQCVVQENPQLRRRFKFTPPYGDEFIARLLQAQAPPKPALPRPRRVARSLLRPIPRPRCAANCCKCSL